MEKNEQNMRKENIQGSTASLPGFSVPQESKNGTSPLRPVFWGKRMAWIFLLVSLAVTFFAWNLARDIALQRAHDRFVFRAQTIESALRERLDSCAFLLQSGAGLFANSEEVTREEWRTYLRELQIDQHYPGVQGLGFAKRILPAEKKAHIRQIREEGFPDYDIHPDGARPEYTPIIFLEPFDWRNQRAFGYDMFSEPTRKEAMVMARDTGSAALSGMVTLLQETEKDVQAGFLMYLPVYRKGAVPEIPEQRREALKGYVYSPFRMSDFMQGLLKEKRGYVELQIFDGDEPRKEALLYPSGDMDVLSQSDHVHFATYQSILEYAGRRWFLVFKSSPYFEETIDTGNVNSILYLGIIISLLVFSVVLSLTKSRNQALSLANMALDLEKANLGLRRELVERQQANEEILHLASFPRLNPIPVIELDHAGEVVSFLNPAAAKMFPGLGAMGLSHPLLHGSIEIFADSRQGKKKSAIITESTVGEATFEMHISYVQEIDRIRIYVLDITKRKRVEDELREKERLLLESQRLGHVGSFFLDDTGLMQWSEELYHIFGVSPDTFTPNMESLLSLIHPEDQPSMQAWTDACMAGKKPAALEFRVIFPDGTIHFIRGDGEAVFDSKNRFLYLAGSGQDITEFKKAEEKNRKQQELTTKIIETIPLRVFWKDRDLRYLGCNTLFANDAGLTRPEELIGKTDFEVGWKDRAELYRADDQRVMDANMPKLSYDEPQTTPEGGQIWLRSSKAPLYNEMNETIGILGVYEDITAYKQAAAALEKSERQVRAILDAAVDGILVADAQSHKLQVGNNAICEMLGYSTEELTGLGLKDIHPAEALPEVQRQFEGQLRGEIKVAPDLPVQRKDGSVFFADVSTSLMLLGDRPFVVGVFHDVTERKHAEEALQRYSADLEKKNKELQEALAEVKQLSGMLPICASCKKIRDDKGYWSGVETYVSEHTDAVFSHGICPECEKKEDENLAQLIRENS